MPTELKKSMTKKLTITKLKTVKSGKKKKTEDPDKIFAKLEKKEIVESEGMSGLKIKLYLKIGNLQLFIYCA